MLICVGEGEKKQERMKRHVCHGVCESELVGVRKSVCVRVRLSVRGIQAEQIRMCRSY